MKIIFTFLLLLMVSCSTTNLNKGIPIVKPKCFDGNKEALWDNYVHWNDTMMNTRRLRVKHCVWASEEEFDAIYCTKLDIYHDEVERYTNRLLEIYKKTCPVEGSF